MPDNYYYAKNGAQLQQALTNIISNITQQIGSSSAVATVAQQNTEGALIIRGAFEARAPAADVADSNRYMWFGHLENYWPDKNGNYDFEIYTSAADTLCKGITADALATGEVHCWDAAMSPLWPSPADRAVYTSKKGSDGVVRLIRLTEANVVTNPGNTQLGAADFGVADVTAARSLVSWVLGTDQSTYKSRQFNNSGAYWILGDIVYSTPVVVGPPSLAATPSQTKAIINNTEVGVAAFNAAANSAGFTKYFLNWRQLDDVNHSIKHRDKVIYVGGNDGMIHAFLLSVYDRNNDRWAIYPDGWDSNTEHGNR